MAAFQKFAPRYAAAGQFQGAETEKGNAVVWRCPLCLVLICGLFGRFAFLYHNRPLALQAFPDADAQQQQDDGKGQSG